MAHYRTTKKFVPNAGGGGLAHPRKRDPLEQVPAWVPPKAEAVRTGADDNKKWKSGGYQGRDAAIDAAMKEKP